MQIINQDFFSNLIINLLSTLIALGAGIITFIKQKKIDRKKKSEQNDAVVKYYLILINRIQIAIHQERIYYKEFLDKISKDWDSQPILNVCCLEEKDRFYTEINQIELFKAISDKIAFNEEVFIAYFNIYTYVGSFNVKSKQILEEVNKLIKENLMMRKRFLREKRNLQTNTFLYLSGLNINENDFFNNLLKLFYNNVVNKGGILNISNLYYTYLEPFKIIIEKNLDKVFCKEILSIFNEFVYIIVDLKSISKEGSSMIEDYILELEQLEKDLKKEIDIIRMYSTIKMLKPRELLYNKVKKIFTVK